MKREPNGGMQHFDTVERPTSEKRSKTILRTQRREHAVVFWSAWKKKTKIEGS